jgi:hypothetical protein
LLGILIGILNVFFELYNVIATLLNLFGLNIEKLKLLNNWLDTTTSKPLIDVTHDIPTIGEYDAGKWGDLIAQNTGDTNDQLEAGFNAQLAKLGEIIGVLLGIKLLIGLMFGQSLAKQATGIFGTLENWFGSLFGGGSGAEPGTPGDPLSPENDDYLSPSDASVDTDGATGGFNSLTGEQVGLLSNNISDLNTTTLGATDAEWDQMQAAVDNTAAHGATSTTMLGLQKGLAYAAGAFQIFQGLSPGGTFSQTLGGLGMILGTAFGGPLAPILGPLADMVGSLIGSFIGPQVNAANNPDMFESQTGYGQDIADMLGSAGAGGTTYKETGALSQMFGSGGMLSVIEKYLSGPDAQNTLGTTLYTSLLSMFGASSSGSGKLVWPFKNISQQLVEGASGTSGMAYTYAQFAAGIKQFVTALEYSSNVVANLFANTVDVSNLYGGRNGIVSGPGQNAGAGANGQTQVNLNIGEIHGVTDIDDFKAALQPAIDTAFNEWARKQTTYTRNSGFISGRYGSN